MRVQIHKVPLVLLFSVSTVFVCWICGVFVIPPEPQRSDVADLLAAKSAPQQRLFCMVVTTPWDVNIRGKAIYESWGRNCDKILFLSSEPGDGTLPVVSCNCTESYDALWGKVRIGWVYLHKNFNLDVGAEFDWFLKADDDTFVSISKLKQLLKQYDPQRNLAIGRKNLFHTETIKEFVFLSGGAGYVLSAPAVQAFYRGVVNRVWGCPHTNNYSEDLVVSYCLHSLQQVRFIDANENGTELLSVDHPDFQNVENLADVVPEDTISLHHLPAKYMKPLEQLLH